MELNFNFNEQLNLRKLCRFIDRIDNDYDGIDVKVLFDEMIVWDKKQQAIFHNYFIKNLTYREVADNNEVSLYKVKKTIKDKIFDISLNKKICRTNE